LPERQKAVGSRLSVLKSALLSSILFAILRAEHKGKVLLYVSK